MELKKLTEFELHEEIGTYEHRVERLSNYLADCTDSTILGVLHQQMRRFDTILIALHAEKGRRMKNKETSENNGRGNGRDISSIRFNSTDHVRYQNGRDVSGHNPGANRGIEIRPNIWGNEGYTVTIYNHSGHHPL